MVGDQVAQFAGEDDDIVGVFVVSFRRERVLIGISSTTVTEAENREEDLECTFAVELVCDYGRDLRSVRNTMSESVVVRAFDDTVGYSRELHTGVQVCFNPNTDFVVEECFEAVTCIGCYFPCALLYAQVGRNDLSVPFFDGIGGVGILISATDPESEMNPFVESPSDFRSYIDRPSVLFSCGT